MGTEVLLKKTMEGLIFDDRQRAIHLRGDKNTTRRSVVATANKSKIDPNTVISEAIAGIVLCGLRTQGPAQTHFEDDHVHLLV